MPSKNQYNDFMRMFSEFKAPTMDMNSLFSTQRRNIEAFSSAGQTMVEGVQAASRRQTEVMKDCVEGCIRVTKDMMTTPSPETNTAKQVDFARSMYETMVQNSREICETVYKSCFEAYELLNKRAAESMEEMARVAR